MAIDEKKLIEDIKRECSLNAGGLYEEDIVKIIESQPKISLENKTSDKNMRGK